jgi:hypothetical protein
VKISCRPLSRTHRAPSGRPLPYQTTGSWGTSTPASSADSFPRGRAPPPVELNPPNAQVIASDAYKRAKGRRYATTVPASRHDCPRGSHDYPHRDCRVRGKCAPQEQPPLTFTDNTPPSELTLTADGALTGLGNGDVCITLTALAQPTATCTNPGNGGNQPPGQNPAPVSVSGSEGIPAGDIKNGNVSFMVETEPPQTPIDGARDCRIPRGGRTSPT